MADLSSTAMCVKHGFWVVAYATFRGGDEKKKKTLSLSLSRVFQILGHALFPIVARFQASWPNVQPCEIVAI